jgi:hypothetical protein
MQVPGKVRLSVCVIGRRHVGALKACIQEGLDRERHETLTNEVTAVTELSWPCSKAIGVLGSIVQRILLDF